MKFIAWLIPVLGFIGTVGGISFAIAKFPELFQAGAGSLQDNIGPVTGNLGVAFETTLMALVEIAIIIFFLYAVQKRGNELLNAFDEFCLDHLLGKVRGAGIAEDAGPFSDLARVLSDHVEHMEEKFEKAVGRVVEKMVENENERWTSFTESFRAVAKEHQEAVHSSCEWMTRESSRLAEELKAWDNKFRACIEEMVRDIGEIEKQRLDNLNSAVGRIEELLKSARELEALQQTLQANLAAIAETGDVRKAMDRLNESTEQLRPVLADLQKKRRMQVRIVDEVEE
jgi:methyl-accepting chemotaxis protein